MIDIIKKTSKETLTLTEHCPLMTQRGRAKKEELTTHTPQRNETKEMHSSQLTPNLLKRGDHDVKLDSPNTKQQIGENTEEI